MSDRFDDDGPKPSPSEGVRILGAEEAQAALDAGAVRAPADSGTDAARPGTAANPAAPVPPAAPAPAPPPAPTPQPPVPLTDAPYEDELDLEELEAEEQLEAAEALAAGDELPPRFPDDGPTWSASVTPETPTGELEVPVLPHWSEPATGAVPAIFADDGADSDEEGDADLDAWASLSGSQPRFRAEGSDWAEADFAEGEFTDDHPRDGALSNESPVDEEVAFAEAVEARAPRRAPVVPTPPRQPRRAPATAPAARRRPPTGYSTEAARTGSGRDLPTAVATAVIIGAISLLCFFLGTATTSALAAVIVAACALEFANGLQEKGFRPATLLAAIGSAGLVLAARNYGVDAYPVLFAVVTIATFMWFLLEVTPGRPALGIATTLMTFAYIGGLGGFAGLLLQPDPDGVGLLLGVAICVIASDVFGFFIGSQFGKTPIASRISPHKSVQGTLAGMAASVVFGWLVAGSIGPWDRSSGFALGALVAVGALLGDLSESLVKRDLGIKDFGSVLPGHGGVLDRFDALVFCLPITYFLALHLNLL